MVMVPAPGESPRERHLAFIEANLTALLLAAIDGYRRKGCGIILIHEADFANKPRGVVTSYRRLYIAAGSPELAVIGGWPGEREAQWFRDYEPCNTILIAVLRDPDGISSYRVRAPGR